METQIKTPQDAFNFLGLDINALPDVSMLPVKHQKYMIANYKLVIITEALNKEYSEKNKLDKPWQPDWNDDDQAKYFPWFEVEASESNPSGFGFSGTDCVYWTALTFVGSRLCFPTSELALYSGKQFEDLHIDHQLIIK